MDSVIVYRNPLEAMIWESLMNGGAGPFFAIVLCALAGVLTYAAIERIGRDHWRQRRLTHTYGTTHKVPNGIALWMVRHNGKISIAVSLLSAAAMHHWYVYG